MQHPFLDMVPFIINGIFRTFYYFYDKCFQVPEEGIDILMYQFSLFDFIICMQHVPRTNGDMPSYDEVTSDHQRLLNRYHLYFILLIKIKEMSCVLCIIILHRWDIVCGL